MIIKNSKSDCMEVDEDLKSVILFKKWRIPLSEIAITELGEFCDLFGRN